MFVFCFWSCLHPPAPRHVLLSLSRSAVACEFPASLPDLFLDCDRKTPQSRIIRALFSGPLLPVVLLQTSLHTMLVIKGFRKRLFHYRIWSTEQELSLTNVLGDPPPNTTSPPPSLQIFVFVCIAAVSLGWADVAAMTHSDGKRTASSLPHILILKSSNFEDYLF